MVARIRLLFSEAYNGQQSRVKIWPGSSSARKRENRAWPWLCAVCRKLRRLHPYTAKLAFSGTHYLNQRSGGHCRHDPTDNGTFLPESYWRLTQMLILIFFDILVEISAGDPPPIANSVHFARGRHFRDDVI